MSADRPLLAAAAAILAGCAHPPDPGPPVELGFAREAGECRFLAEGRSLTSTELAEAARRWRRRGARISGLAADMPGDCFVAAILILERTGGRIGFISEPPPRR